MNDDNDCGQHREFLLKRSSKILLNLLICLSIAKITITLYVTESLMQEQTMIIVSTTFCLDNLVLIFFIC